MESRRPRTRQIWRLLNNGAGTKLEINQNGTGGGIIYHRRIRCSYMLRIILFTIVFFLPAYVASNEKVRVASINVCADQLAILLADTDQILSLSNLSHQEAGSYYYEKARAYPVNEGHAEQILNLQPDIVIAGQYSSPHTVALLKDTGLQIHTLPLADTIETVFENIQSVARWVGHAERGEVVVAELRDRLARIRQFDASQANASQASVSQDRGLQPMAAVFDPNGYTSGATTLRGQMMEIAGFRNAASEAGIERYGSLSLEKIINLNPDALIESPYSPGTWSRAQAMSQHPALTSAGINPQVIHIPSRMTVCGGPWTLSVIEQLHAARIKLTGTSK